MENLNGHATGNGGYSQGDAYKCRLPFFYSARTAEEIKYEEVAERRKVFGDRSSVKVATACGIRTAE
jgi:hypothetical protein